MALFLLVFAVCMLVLCSVVGILMLSRTPRYRTEPKDLLALFDKAIDGSVGETEWNTIIGYPVRHDDYLENVRRRAQHLMDEHGRPWRAARGEPLMSPAGREELAALRDHLAAHTALREQQRQDAE
ncbi:hypothetical protein GCM10007160_23670 [Litchfieldella qijiaojingensis]|uniref:Uncharacterized protein n=1 Tax=Litchfieldella qijiaojingensis TaxID=980347 RepID=A0ABQ2YW92_9GAMM|nr:hypothetical protein [Halomonas qijiaojingensis]GGX95363.1 hypothetical protein GCM10007160_23670 [Halomonas qijiaojingensis]